MDLVKQKFEKTDVSCNGTIPKEALTKALLIVCKDLGPEVVQLLVTAYDPSGHDTVIYSDFIEWLFKSLENVGGVSSSITTSLERNGSGPTRPGISQSPVAMSLRRGERRMFLCHQQTLEATRVRAEWLKGEADSVRASCPPFNTRFEVELPPNTQVLNIATFGVRLPRVIMALFESEEMRAFSEKRKIPIPPYALDTFVQKKMPKVLDLAAEARKVGANSAAVDKLEAFCKEFQQLNAKTIPGPVQFKDFVERHVPAGWEDQLHFDHVLPVLFGIDPALSEQLRKATITVKEKDKDVEVPLEHHALRWLTKAFKGYGPVGCLTDLVNLVYAMLGLEQPQEASEEAVVKEFARFHDCFARKDFSNLWLPSHLVHDAESDDSLSWLLLDYIHSVLGTQLEVMIQLPADGDLDHVAKFFEAHPTRPQVFRDSDSANGKAVKNAWKQML